MTDDFIPEPQTVTRLPDPSRAARLPSARSRASTRSVLKTQLPADVHPRHLWCESKLEQRVLFLLAAHPETWDIQEQPPAITWTTDCGTRRQHFFDFLLTQRSGERFAIAVKRAEIVTRSGFRADLQLIREATPFSFARHVVLITDRSFTLAEAENAERLHQFRQSPDPEADAAVAALLNAVTTETTIASVVEASGLGGRAFRAVFRAIYAGLARAVTSEAKRVLADWILRPIAR